ncbi:MAG: hypothetical protein RMX68_007650 [Aulosira sp. ZfuVER01]|nr:hypothetical protein [Aulosira sp. DedVER01a]MDZ8053636.1 hypothetical protein [Aulosira sp. ZfuCHP01]
MANDKAQSLATAFLSHPRMGWRVALRRNASGVELRKPQLRTL